MSLFIRVVQFGAKPKLLHWGGLAGYIGEDERGILSANDPCRLFFAILAINTGYTLRSETPGLSINGSMLEQFSLTNLQSGDVVTKDDYKFHFYSTSPKVEILSGAKLSLDETIALEECLTPSLPLATLIADEGSRQYPLLPGIKFTVGSGAECLCMVDDPDIESRHLEILNVSKLSDDPKLLISPILGQFCIDTSVFTKPQVITSNALIRITPSNIKIKIEFR